MPKPKNKYELLEQSQLNYQSLIQLVHSYSEEEIKTEFPKGMLNRNIKDVLAHLHEWHVLLLSWHKAGLDGEKPTMPAAGYTWQSLPQLNKDLWNKNKDIELDTALNLLAHSFQETQAIMNHYSDEELFEKKRYAWTGSTSLGAYLILNTSSHYNWAIKLIKKSMKKI